MMNNINVDGKTKLAILIGNPVEHSLSPRMHTSAFKEIGYNAIYIACKVEKDKLFEVVESIKALNLLGANVTIPHKVDIMEFVDDIDPIARDIGAINTIVNNNGNLYATNTDGIGAIRSIKEGGIDLKDKNVVMIGSGGVARPIAFYLLKEIKHLFLTDINREASSTLEKALLKRYEKKVSAFDLTEENLGDFIEKSNILMNCTPVGMYPNIDKTPVPKKLLRPDLSIFDVVYNPLETKLVREAKEVGSKAIGGIKMFLYQGVEGFELWTKQKAPVNLMEKIIIEELSRKK